MACWMAQEHLRLLHPSLTGFHRDFRDLAIEAASCCRLAGAEGLAPRPLQRAISALAVVQYTLLLSQSCPHPYF